LCFVYFNNLVKYFSGARLRRGLISSKTIEISRVKFHEKHFLPWKTMVCRQVTVIYKCKITNKINTISFKIFFFHKPPITDYIFSSGLSVNFNWNDCNWEFKISIYLKSGYLSFALELVIENVRAICWIVSVLIWIIIYRKK
jgi:hypothetical protein